MADIRVRKEMPSAELSRREFTRRFHNRFYDPAFEPLRGDIEKLAAVAWESYSNSRKSPRVHPIGPGHVDSSYEVSVEWLAARAAIEVAEKQNKDAAAPTSILIINGATRSEHTCPGETSKTFRLATLARQIVAAEPGIELQFLDLSRLASEYERNIYPCKTCVSTAMPLCHWPCSCYPNHSLGQVNDWMNEIYPMWVRAHGIMILCPVNWYQAPSTLKLMIDRLVCADGGNPDPSSTHGKNVEQAKAIELEGWTYPHHLAGRVFSVIAHGDAEGAYPLHDMLANWLDSMGLIAAGGHSQLGTYIGYMRPYATSHDDLDQDTAVQEEVRNAARALIEAVTMLRRGELKQPGESLRDPRPK
jgi:multimeric flavodoxin WrbA